MSKQKENVEMVKPAAGQAALLPDYLRDKTVVGVEAVRDYIVMQRIKLVQKSAKTELVNQFGFGGVILSPSNVVIAPLMLDRSNKTMGSSEPFIFTPLFFFPSWGQLNDLKLRGSEPMFLNYTTDKSSPIAAKAKNQATREEPHPTKPDMKLKNIEMLNFVVAIEDDKFKDLPIVMTFARGEWMTGSGFLSKIKSTRASIFARRWQASSNIRSTAKGEWAGLDIVEPDDNQPWVTKDAYEAYEASHQNFLDLHTKMGIKPDDAEDLASGPEAAPSAGSAQY